ncbi:MAG TPA: translation initiation factor IF-2 N-terminal domain-containing protein, partial [Thermodesulfovibrionales bacterium]|nr:translation initiation factor IF-2 N-terminal domain-containing protein [Thermodesulfovibrionales bacterium]
MSKLRIYELAKKLNVTHKEVISELSKLGISVKSHASTIEDGIAAKVEAVFKKKQKPAPVAKPKTAKP